MNPDQRNRGWFAVSVLAAGVIAIMVGCSSQPPAATAPTATPADSSAIARPPKGRAEIWTENCARCHNMRPLEGYSGAQWEVAMQHMRIRGYLTEDEHKSISELLQASK